MLLLKVEELEQLRKNAENHPFTLNEIQQMLDGELEPPGEMEQFTMYMDPDWKLVYSIGMYPTKCGGQIPMRHMSISSKSISNDRPPNAAIIQYIATFLGFPSLLDCSVTIQNDILIVVSEITKPT